MNAPSLPSLLVTHWELSPWLASECAVLAALYVSATARVRGRWPLKRTAAFLAGLGCVLVALASGLDTYDDRMLSVHMVQHLLLLAVAPLLLIAGRPVILALRVLPSAGRMRLVGGLRHLRRVIGPWQGLAIYFVVIGVTHTPWFYDAALRHPPLHVAEHALYLFAGTLALWPILDGDPVPAHRLGPLAKLGYLLGAMLPMAAIGAYLNRQPNVVYAPYRAAAHSLGISAITDQNTAGAIMWVIGNTLMVLVGLGAVMAALVADERRQRARDAHLPAAAGPGVTRGRVEP